MGSNTVVTARALVMLSWMACAALAPAEILWHFDTAGDAEGWDSEWINNVDDFDVAQGTFRFRVAGGDPWIASPPIDQPAVANGYIVLRFRTSGLAGDSAQIFFTTDVDPSWNEVKKVTVPLGEEDAFQTWALDMSLLPEWTGNVTGIRFDPGFYSTSGDVEIDYIGLMGASGVFWEFESDGDFEGWDTPWDNNIAGKTVSDGVLSFEITGLDPWLSGPTLSAPASLYQYLLLRMRQPNASQIGQVYFKTDINPTMGENQVALFDLGTPDTWQEYVLPFTDQARWVGTVEQLRIDPANSATSGRVEIDSIALVPPTGLPPQAEIELFAVEDELLMQATRQATLTARIRNTGPVTIGELTAALDLPGSLTLMSGTDPTSISMLQPGETLELHWTVRPESRLFDEGLLTIEVAGEELDRDVALFYATETPAPDPSNAPAGGIEVIEQPGYVWLGNDWMRLLVQREGDPTRYGPIYLDTRQDDQWRRVAVTPVFSTLVYDDTASATVLQPLEPATHTVLDLSTTHVLARFSGATSDTAGRRFDYAFDIQLVADDLLSTFSYQLSADQPYGLRRFDGPLLFCGNDPNLERSEALQPGLDWLEADEVSSSDVFDRSADHERFAAHPYKYTQPWAALRFGELLVTLIWDNQQAWNVWGDQLPVTFFSTPDRYYGNLGSHVMGLFLPGFGPWYHEHQRDSLVPCPVVTTDTLTLTQAVWLKRDAGSALEAMDYYFATRGAPEPSPIPRGSLMEELKFTAQAFMDTMWIPEDKEWFFSIGALIIGRGKLDTAIAFLTRSAHVLDDPALASSYTQRAELVMAEPDAINAGLHLPFLYGNASAVWGGAVNGSINSLARRDSRGLWFYDNDQDYSPLVPRDTFETIGPDNVPELGSGSASAFNIMNYAMINGDYAILEQFRPSLEAFKQFRVPRGAQVWEIPLGAPESLAASHMVTVYTHAYRMSGDPSYLEEARYWARACLQFIYTWELPQYDFMRYSSIPVYGATYFTGSWLGRPVQWLGIDSARAWLDLDRVDGVDYDWRKLALGVTISGMRQQRTEPQYLATYPDSWDLRANTWSTFLLNPSQIGLNALDEMGYPWPWTEIVEIDGIKVHITSYGEVLDADITTTAGGYRLTFDLRYTPRKRIFTMVAGVSDPTAVTRNGEALARESVMNLSAPESFRWLEPAQLEIVNDFATTDTNTYVVDFISPIVERGMIAELDRQVFTLFAEDNNYERWQLQHDFADYSVSGGELNFETSAPDPYLTKRVALMPDQFDRFVFRMAIDGGSGGQFFYGNSVEPWLSEARSVVFPVNTDGAPHTYELLLSGEDGWTSHAITETRIDPTNAGGASARVDWIVTGTSSDRDGDGAPDQWETAYGYDPLDPQDGALDDDGDGLDTAAEYRNQTHPREMDSDRDNYADNDELAAGSDPGWYRSTPPANPFSVLMDLDFAAEPQQAATGWTTATNSIHSAPLFSLDSNGLGLTAVDNQTWGAWVAPPMNVGPGFVYLVEAEVAGSADAPDRVPTFGLGAGNEDGYYDATYQVSSSDDNNYGPTQAGRTYFFAFQPPEGARQCRVRCQIDALNPAKDPAGAVFLERIRVSAYPADRFDTRMAVSRSQFFYGFNGWEWWGSQPGFDEPQDYRQVPGGLFTRAVNSTNTLGSWRKTSDTVVYIDGDHMYRSDFHVGTNVAATHRHPGIRLRISTADPVTTSTVLIRSTRVEAPLTASSPMWVPVYMQAPPNLEDAGNLERHFDLFNDEPNNAPNGAIFLLEERLWQLSRPTETLQPAPATVPADALPTGARGWKHYLP